MCGTDGITYLSGCFAGCKSTVRGFPGGMGWGSRAATAAPTRVPPLCPGPAVAERPSIRREGRPGPAGLPAKWGRFSKSVTEQLKGELSKEGVCLEPGKKMMIRGTHSGFQRNRVTAQAMSSPSPGACMGELEDHVLGRPSTPATI